jgi:hypothetical protein
VNREPSPSTRRNRYHGTFICKPWLWKLRPIDRGKDAWILMELSYSHLVRYCMDTGNTTRDQLERTSRSTSTVVVVSRFLSGSHQNGLSKQLDLCCWGICGFSTGPSVKSSVFAEMVNPSANESFCRCTFGGGFYSANQNRGAFSKIKTG